MGFYINPKEGMKSDLADKLNWKIVSVKDIPILMKGDRTDHYPVVFVFP